jgi:predicted nucleic acid-binding protein
MDRLFFDTNVLIAAAWLPHPFHAASRRCLDEGSAIRGTAVTCLAEAFRVMCVTPQIGMTRAEASALIEDMATRLRIESVPAEGAIDAIALVAKKQLSVHSVFDQLIAATAHHHRYGTIVTWNRKDFLNLPFKMNVVTPDEIKRSSR